MATAEKKRPRISSGAGRRPSRKEVLERKKAIGELIRKAIAVKDHLAQFPAFHKFQRNGNYIVLFGTVEVPMSRYDLVHLSVSGSQQNKVECKICPLLFSQLCSVILGPRYQTHFPGSILIYRPFSLLGVWTWG